MSQSAEQRALFDLVRVEAGFRGRWGLGSGWWEGVMQQMKLPLHWRTHSGQHLIGHEPGSQAEDDETNFSQLKLSVNSWLFFFPLVFVFFNFH